MYLYECRKCKLKFTSHEENLKCIKCNGKLNKSNIDDISIPNVLPFSNININNILKKEKNRFLKNLKINNLNKIYIPVFITNFKMTGNLTMEGVVETKINKYIKSDKYEIDGVATVDYKDYIISLSKIVDTKTLNKIGPFKLDKEESKTDEIVEYHEFKKQDVDIYTNNEFVELFKDKLYNYKKVLPKDLKITKKEGKLSYLLFPVFTFNLGKTFFIVNGQTGKFNDKIKYDKIRLIVFSLILFIITFILVYLIYRVIK